MGFRGQNGSYCDAIERVSSYRRIDRVLHRCSRRARYFITHRVKSRLLFALRQLSLGKGYPCYPVEAFLGSSFAFQRHTNDVDSSAARGFRAPIRPNEST
jgi:hypothetical protein